MRDPVPPPESTAPPAPWVSETVLKTDVFSQIEIGTLGGTKAILRDLSKGRWWAARLSAHFAWREARALRHLADVQGVPRLLAEEKGRLWRGFLAGLPMHVAQPRGDAAYFREGARILRQLRRRGVTHNDLAKEPNWLVGQDGRPYLLDFQLASIHRRKGRLYRIMAYEDLRHLLKHKRTYCPEELTARERAIIRQRSLPSRLWKATGKKVYNAVTRGLFNYSDGEGGRDRLITYGPKLTETLASHPAVAEAAVVSYPNPRMIEGLYAFVTVAGAAEGVEIARWTKAKLGAMGAADLVQVVPALPKSGGGIRRDILKTIAQNLLDETGALVGDDAALAEAVRPIVAGRLNLKDRPMSGGHRAAAE
jgi:hypothetical protein